MVLRLMRLIKWLELAKGVAENEAQGNALGLLIDYYKNRRSSNLGRL